MWCGGCQSLSLYIYILFLIPLVFFLFFLKLCTSFTFSFLITSHRFVFSPPHTSTITNADLPISALVFHTVLFLLHIVFGITLVNCTMLIQCPSSISLTLSSEILFCFECLFPRKILLDCDFFLFFYNVVESLDLWACVALIFGFDIEINRSSAVVVAPLSSVCALRFRFSLFIYETIFCSPIPSSLVGTHSIIYVMCIMLMHVQFESTLCCFVLNKSWKIR